MSGASRAPATLPRERTFGLFFAALSGAVAVHRYVGGHVVPSFAFGLVAGVFAAAALFVPAWLAPLNRAWHALGLLLARVVNPIVLAVLFYLVVSPYALLLRAFGRDPLRLRRDPAGTTYWIEHDPPGPGRDALPRPY